MSGPPGIGDIADILKYARRMGEELRDLRERLKGESFTASVGGGLVKATVNGEGEVVKLEIDDSLVTSAEKEVLEDLAAAAVNEASKKSRERLRREVSRLSGGLDLAGILGLS